MLKSKASILKLLIVPITATLSTKTIRKGDQFGIYLDVKNGLEKEITVTNVELTAPMGFIDIGEEAKRKKTTGGSTGSTTSNGTGRSANYHVNSPLVQVRATALNVIVQPGSSYRYEYTLQAGTSLGPDPKPDTHKMSFKVNYCKPDQANETVGDQTATDIEVNIFPSFTSMLIGTLGGSALGTIAIKGFNFMDHTLIDAIILNLIFAFVAAVILVRRKDVQSFITIEDFWGGILIGFIIGYAGFKAVQSLMGLAPLTPTH